MKLIKKWKKGFSMSKKFFTNKNWEEFCNTYKRLYPDDEPLGEKERQYLETHLTTMDDVKKAWYFHSMRTWKDKDYENYEKFHLWMFGELDEDSGEMEP
ncbi:MAG: hypothetical protein ACPL6D_07070 [Thermodesulfobacteriota bacterium]